MFPLRTVILAEAICTTIRPEFRVPTDLFLLFAHDHSTKIYGPLSFNLSFVHDNSTKTQLARVLTGLFFYLHTTIRQKMYRPLSFILSFVYDHSTKIRVLIDLFLLFVHDHSTKLYGPLSFILSLLCVRPFDQKLGSSLVYLFYLYTTIRPKIGVLSN